MEDNDVFDKLLIFAKCSLKELSLIAKEVPVVVKVNPRIKVTTSHHSEPVFFNSFDSMDSLKKQSNYFFKYLNHIFLTIKILFSDDLIRSFD